MSSVLAHKDYLRKNHARCCELIARLNPSLNDNVTPLSCEGLQYDGHRNEDEDCVFWCSLNSCKSVFVKCLFAIFSGSIPHNPRWVRRALKKQVFSHNFNILLYCWIYGMSSFPCDIRISDMYFLIGSWLGYWLLVLYVCRSALSCTVVCLDENLAILRKHAHCPIARDAQFLMHWCRFPGVARLSLVTALCASSYLLVIV